MPNPRPNILFIVVDDHQADAIGALGHPVVQTPTLDALIARGACWVNIPDCLAIRLGSARAWG